MDRNHRRTDSFARRSRVGIFTLLGGIAFIAASIVLENETGVRFDTTYRVACAVVCPFFIYWLKRDYPGERWPRVGCWIALLVNACLFLTPLVDRPASRGEIMLFALPDTVIALSVAILSYHVVDDHSRAQRQIMIFSWIVAVVACAGLFALTLIVPVAPPMLPARSS